ncbi:MAG: transposase [Candidatus Competibacteraceae bacterium]|nr:transposase [Candidatus Competibacteraceae bacterium]
MKSLEKVQIIIDRFHVAKLYGKGLDDLRKKRWHVCGRTYQKSSIKS